MWRMQAKSEEVHTAKTYNYSIHREKKEMKPSPQGRIATSPFTLRDKNMMASSPDALSKRPTPRSPTGVEEVEDDELATSFFSIASFKSDLFPKETNPFRVTDEIYTPWSVASPSKAKEAGATDKSQATTSNEDREFDELFNTPVTSKAKGGLREAPKSRVPKPKDLNDTEMATMAEASLEELPVVEKKAHAVRIETVSSNLSSTTNATREVTGQVSTRNHSLGTSSSAPPRPTKTKYQTGPGTSTATESPSTGAIRFQDAITSKLRLYIDDYDPGFFTKLMHDLMSQPRVAKLDIFRNEHPSQRIRSTEDMALFFQVVQSLPNLKTLHLSNLDASSNDLEHLPGAVFGHRRLQIVKLHMVNGGIDVGTLRALNTVPRLTEVSLIATTSFDFSLLLRSTTLRRLHIASTKGTSFAFENAHVMSAVPMLECNRVLVELDLEPEMSFLAFKFLANSLRLNRSVEVLQVFIEGTSSQLLVEQAISEIAAVLIFNSTLRVLNNANYNSLLTGMPSCRKILRALETNVTMEHFHLFQEDASFTKQKNDLLRPMDTSKSGVNKSFGDGSTYRSSVSSFYTYDSSREMDETDDTSTRTSLPRFCGGFEVPAIGLDLEPVAEEAKKVARDLQMRFSTAAGSAAEKMKELRLKARR